MFRVESVEPLSVSFCLYFHASLTVHTLADLELVKCRVCHSFALTAYSVSTVFLIEISGQIWWVSSHSECVLWDAGPAPQLPPSMPLGLPPTNPAGNSLLAFLADLWALCARGCVCICVYAVLWPTYDWVCSSFLGVVLPVFPTLTSNAHFLLFLLSIVVRDCTDVNCRCCTKATAYFCPQLHASRPTPVLLHHILCLVRFWL